VRNNPVNSLDPFGLQATNPAGAFGDIFGQLNDAGQGAISDRAFNNLDNALDQFESTLDPGQQQSVDVIVDPSTGEIIDIFPSDQDSLFDQSSEKVGPFELEGFEDNLTPLPDGFRPEDNPTCKA